VNETIAKNSTLQDLDVIEENIANLNQRHDDLSKYVQEKDLALAESIEQKHKNSIDVDLNRHVRSQYEAKNNDIAETRAS